MTKLELAERRISDAGEKLASQMGWSFKIVPQKLRDYRRRAQSTSHTGGRDE